MEPVLVLNSERCSKGKNNEVEEKGQVQEGHNSALERVDIGLNGCESN